VVEHPQNLTTPLPAPQRCCRRVIEVAGAVHPPPGHPGTAWYTDVYTRNGARRIKIDVKIKESALPFTSVYV